MPKPLSFFEPWSAARSKLSQVIAFPNGIPEDADREAAEKHIAACERANEHADWIVWGTGMTTPQACTNFEGKHTVLDGRQIVTAIRNVVVEGKSAPNAEQFAKRIAATVNACAGMPDPERTIAGVRRLLLEMLRGETDQRDDRVLSLLSQMIPPEELENFRDEDDC